MCRSFVHGFDVGGLPFFHGIDISDRMHTIHNMSNIIKTVLNGDSPFESQALMESDTSRLGLAPNCQQIKILCKPWFLRSRISHALRQKLSGDFSCLEGDEAVFLYINNPEDVKDLLSQASELIRSCIDAHLEMCDRERLEYEVDNT